MSTVQGPMMFTGNGKSIENCDVNRELVCLQEPVTSTGNCDVHRELACLQGPVMFTGTGMSIGNCDVNREMLCLQGPVTFTGTVLSTRKFCRYISNLQPNTCWE